MIPEQTPVPTLNNVPPSEEGQVSASPQESSDLQGMGFTKCYNPVCDYHIHPNRSATHDEYDGFDCPSCQKSYDLLSTSPFGSSQGQFTPGGGTIVGLDLSDQGQRAEDLLKGLGELPGYGPFTWWAPTYHSPLDAAMGDWGVEVKGLASTAKNLRFIPGRLSEKTAKNELAAQMGFQGILGILVLFDFRRSVADVYLKEMPLDRKVHPRQKNPGVFAYRHHTVPRFLEEVPFSNPFLEPDHPAPHAPDIPF